jgi:hypothetical protein
MCFAGCLVCRPAALLVPLRIVRPNMRPANGRGKRGSGAAPSPVDPAPTAGGTAAVPGKDR